MVAQRTGCWIVQSSVHREKTVKPIIIIGGGLAGLTLGIGLRERDVPVTIFEASHYPRHRVCGEFISGAGVAVLRRLGVSGTQCAETASFYNDRRAVGRHSLPVPALTISRHALDLALATRFQELGGNLRAGQRSEVVNVEGTVCAAGRRASPVEGGWRWFGLKVHARNVELESDLEMHLSANSYVGLCRLPGGEVNVCGLFRRRVGEGAQGGGVEWLRGSQGSPLFARLEEAEFDKRSFCAVAGLCLNPLPIEGRHCRIGDALTMIPPITGNGMSMAFESAELAARPLADYSSGRNTWEEVSVQIARSLQRTFARRLNWAARLHRLMFSPAGAVALPLLFRANPLWRASFAVTR
jgi:menaquinone-9 beta-reductase